MRNLAACMEHKHLVIIPQTIASDAVNVAREPSNASVMLTERRNAKYVDAPDIQNKAIRRNRPVESDTAALQCPGGLLLNARTPAKTLRLRRKHESR